MSDPITPPRWLSDFVSAWNDHDPDSVAALVTDDVHYADLAVGADLKGREEVRGYVAGMTQTWSSDFRFTVDRVIEDHDSYCFEWTATGTNDGADPAMGLPATGKTFSIPGVSVGTLVDGKVADNRDYWNLAGYLLQIGLMPTP